MLDTFHLFPNLPKELRDYIWSLAIRPSRPGVHVFTIRHRTRDRHADEAAFEAWLVKTPASEKGSEMQLAAPRHPSSNEYSWTRDNPSAYMLDGGLWTACRESREAMRRHLLFGDPKRGAGYGTPVTGYFKLRGGCQFFSIFPRHDLVVLRPQYLPNVLWDFRSWDIPFAQFDEAVDQNGGLRNVALEYTKEMLVPFEMSHSTPFSHSYMHRWGNVRGFRAMAPPSMQTSPSAFQRPGMTDCLHNASRVYQSLGTKLWLIDYDIRRSQALALSTPLLSKTVFHGNGRRYIEVGGHEPAWDFSRCSKSSYSNDPGVFRLVNILDRGSRVAVEISPQIGVLACEED